MGFRSLNTPATMALRVIQFLVYVVFRVGAFFLRLMPLGLCYRVGRIAGYLGYYFDGGHRRITQKNLNFALGDELDEATRKKMARECFANVGGNMVCSLKFPLMTEEAISSRVEVVGGENAKSAAQDGRGFIYAIPHSGNWELLSQIPALVTFGLRRGALYQPLANPYINNYVVRCRKHRGYDLFDRRQGFNAPTKFVREGGVIGVLVDQHAGDSGNWSPFFGRLASTTNLAALLAKRTRTPIVPLAVQTTGIAKWRVSIGPALSSAGDVAQTTADLNVLLEQLIRQSPNDWFWVHNRWKTPHPKFLLQSYRRGITLPTGFTQAQLKPFRILVRSPNWLGDACMAIPAVRAIKEGRPDARVIILTPSKWAALWERVPEVDEVVTKEDGDSPATVRRKLRAHSWRYDAAVLLPNSLRSALEVQKLGIDRIAGFAGHSRKRYLGPIVPDAPAGQAPEHHALRYMRIASEAGAKLRASYPGPYVRSTTAQGQEHQLTAGQTGSFRIGICPGAEYGPTKRLPAEVFLESAKLLATRFPNAIFPIFGTAADTEAAAVIEAGLGARAENLIGKTDLAGLIDGLIACHTLITNDTGTMHLAAAVGTPTVPIFGSTEPVLTGPLGGGHQIVRNHIDCSPCFLRECPRDFECMRSVTPHQVANATLTVLEKIGGAAAKEPSAG